MNMLLQLTVAVAVIAGTFADVYHQGGHEEGSKYHSSGRYYYGGVYKGKCGSDGLYYNDEYSFVMCSNGNSYVQPCAPGTSSSGYNSYTAGSYYQYSHFCDVNLNDYGYPHGQYKPAHAAPVHAAPVHKGAYPSGDSYHKESYGPVDSYHKNSYYGDSSSYGNNNKYDARPYNPSYGPAPGYGYGQGAPHKYSGGYAGEKKTSYSEEKAYEYNAEKKAYAH